MKTTSTTRDAMTTYTDREAAENLMRIRNRASRGGIAVVLVEGPGDDEVTLMSLRDAVDNEFAYTWAC